MRFSRQSRLNRNAAAKECDPAKSMTPRGELRGGWERQDSSRALRTTGGDERSFEQERLFEHERFADVANASQCFAGAGLQEQVSIPIKPRHGDIKGFCDRIDDQPVWFKNFELSPMHVDLHGCMVQPKIGDRKLTQCTSAATVVSHKNFNALIQFRCLRAASKSENLTSSLKNPGSCSRSPADMAVFTV